MLVDPRLVNLSMKKREKEKLLKKTLYLVGVFFSISSGEKDNFQQTLPTPSPKKLINFYCVCIHSFSWVHSCVIKLSEEKLQTENSPKKKNTHHIAKKFIEL
jgi:hypothetical protein